MFRLIQNGSRGSFDKFNKFSRKFSSKPDPGVQAGAKQSGGFLKSGLVILGGFYGYKYFTGELEDINLYHVTFSLVIDL